MSKIHKITAERADLFDVNMTVVMSVDIACRDSNETKLYEAVANDRGLRTIYNLSEIENAIARTIKSHEVFSTTIRMDDEGNAWYEGQLPREVKPEYTDKDLQELIREQERIRFKIEEGEYLRVFCNCISKERIRLYFFLHHLGGDGKSLCYFIEDFMKVLSGQETKHMEMVSLNEDNMPKGSRMPVPGRWFAARCNRSWKKEKKVFGFEDMKVNFSEFWKVNRTEVITDKLEALEVERLHEECHDRHIGMTSYIIAKWLRDTPGAKYVGIAVDGRTDKNRSMGNQATGISFKYNYQRKKSLIDNAIGVNRKMKRLLNNVKYKYFILHFMGALDGSLVDAVNLEHTNRFSGKVSEKLADILGYRKKVTDLSITNLTVPDIQLEYNKYTIESIVFVPPVISYGKNVLGIVTVKGDMYTTLHRYC